MGLFDGATRIEINKQHKNATVTVTLTGDAVKHFAPAYAAHLEMQAVRNTVKTMQAKRKRR